MSTDTGQLLILGACSVTAVANTLIAYNFWKADRDAKSARIGLSRKCCPDFEFEPLELAAGEDYPLVIARRDDGTLKLPGQEWFVTCRCENALGCAWIKAAEQLGFELGVAEERGLLRPSIHGHDEADGLHEGRNRARVYQLTPKALSLGPEAFIEAVRHAHPPVSAPVNKGGEGGAVDPGARTENRDAEGDDLRPVHAPEHSAGSPA